MPENEAILSAEFQQRVREVMGRKDLEPETKAAAVRVVAADLERRLASGAASEKVVTSDKSLPVDVSGRKPLGIFSSKLRDKGHSGPAAYIEDLLAPKPDPEPDAEGESGKEFGDPRDTHHSKPYVDDLLRRGGVRS